MLCVASGITTMLQINHSIVGTFGNLTAQETFFLLGINIGDESFLRFEVERDGVVFVSLLPHSEHRGAHQFGSGGVGIHTC